MRLGEALRAAKLYASTVARAAGIRRPRVYSSIPVLAAPVTAYLYAWTHELYWLLLTYALMLIPVIHGLIARRSIYTTLLEVAAAAVAAFYAPQVTPIAVVYGLLIEDFTVFLGGYSYIVRLKQTLILAVSPLTTIDTAFHFGIVTLSSLAGYYATRDPLVFVSTAISYVLLTYSYVYWLRIARQLAERFPRGRPLPIPAALAPVAKYVTMIVFSSRNMRLAVEAGILGSKLVEFADKLGDYAAYTLYAALVATPLLYIVAGPLAYTVLAAWAAGIHLYPTLYFSAKRAERLGKLSRNIIQLLTYIASFLSVGSQVSEAFSWALARRDISRTFQVETEARIFMVYKWQYREEKLAIEKYSGTVPYQFYRETLLAIRDALEHAGPRLAFRVVVERLANYIPEYIERVRSRLNLVVYIGIVGVVTAFSGVASLLALSEPQMLPTVIFVIGVPSGAAALAFTLIGMPSTPGEYIFMPKRARRAAILTAILGPIVVLVSKLYASNVYEMLAYDLAGFTVLAVSAAYYALWDDIRVDKFFFDHMFEVFSAFASSLSRTRDVSLALRDMVARFRIFRGIVAELLKRLAAQARPTVGVQLHGPYWFKWFAYFAAFGARFGVVPRDLVREVLRLSRGFREVFTIGREVGSMLLVSMILTTIILNLTLFMSVSALTKTIEVGGNAPVHVSVKLPHLSQAEAETIPAMSLLALEATLVFFAAASSKLISRTMWHPLYYTVLLATAVAMYIATFKLRLMASLLGFPA